MKPTVQPTSYLIRRLHKDRHTGQYEWEYYDSNGEWVNDRRFAAHFNDATEQWSILSDDGIACFIVSSI